MNLLIMKIKFRSIYTDNREMKNLETKITQHT